MCALMNVFGNINFITRVCLRDTIEAHKLEIGCTGSLFSNNLISLNQWTTPSWITHTWTFILENPHLRRKYTSSPDSKTERLLHSGKNCRYRYGGGRAFKYQYILTISPCKMRTRYFNWIRHCNIPQFWYWKENPMTDLYHWPPQPRPHQKFW